MLMSGAWPTTKTPSGCRHVAARLGVFLASAVHLVPRLSWGKAASRPGHVAPMSQSFFVLRKLPTWLICEVIDPAASRVPAEASVGEEVMHELDSRHGSMALAVHASTAAFSMRWS